MSAEYITHARRVIIYCTGGDDVTPGVIIRIGAPSPDHAAAHVLEAATDRAGMPPTHDNTGRGRPRTASNAPLCVIIIMQHINQHAQNAPERAETAFSASTR